MEKPIRQIVTIGGGSGQFVLLSGLRDLKNCHTTAIVSMVDSGGSTGRLRDELGILPPGDILKCILALSPYQDTSRAILLKRFKKDRRLAGHTAGNMLLTMLSRYTGNFPAGVAALAEILEAEGTILPVTIDRATLVAELTDGSRIYGEEAIDIPRGTQRERIKDVFLVPHHHDAISVYPPVLEAIKEAEYIFIGPGDLFTSIIPNLLVSGVKEALQQARGRVFYIINIMTKFGETHHFTGRDFVAGLEDRLGRQVDGVIGNLTCPRQEMLDRYAQQKSDFVCVDPQDPFWGKRTILIKDLLESNAAIVRHDPLKLARVIQDIIAHGI
ncbi:uridine diphosphate-N-acetylglucosamine-binding protein YvcK [uncultured Desulfobacter sp.]|uniref:gluconeogenesis factor YvcK family protein n=1 Tax=uncultured Desulfobacter sp. TaxID=240139 RepID=UPI002AAB51C3|nr:uridine diphosphate-N-acetylglucosamine-binding protein YvcK [uncultured Desulfobacter sp.]